MRANNSAHRTEHHAGNKEYEMEEMSAQLAGQVEESSRALTPRRRELCEMPVRRNGGLDTGARGWRWVMATPSASDRRVAATGH